MIRSLIPLVAVAAAALAVGASAADAVLPGLPERVALGSCHRTGKNSARAFSAVLETRPQAFLFLGDNIYGDTRDMRVLEAKYQALGAIPEWQAIEAACPVLAVWDDHDYGENDGGREFPMAKESAAVFHDFFKFPADHPSRARPGVYHSAVFKDKGRTLQVILLDARTFRSPLAKSRGRYLPVTEKDATILGEAQWTWLEAQLREPADLRLIGSGIQVIPEEHRFEKWANIPAERTCLLAMLADATGKVILLSGDRHMAEFSRIEVGGRTLTEMTSSGMTHAGGGNRDEPNRHRVGERFGAMNFGVLEIDWKGDEPAVTGAVRAIDGAVVRRLEM